ncbi:hypothetical protein [Dietzia psychralcaliphila]|nr:hypothetical protein [Dietzia psychralcaliphila]
MRVPRFYPDGRVRGAGVEVDAPDGGRDQRVEVGINAPGVTDPG